MASSTSSRCRVLYRRQVYSHPRHHNPVSRLAVGEREGNKMDPMPQYVLLGMLFLAGSITGSQSNGWKGAFWNHRKLLIRSTYLSCMKSPKSLNPSFESVSPRSEIKGSRAMCCIDPCILSATALAVFTPTRLTRRFRKVLPLNE